MSRSEEESESERSVAGWTDDDGSDSDYTPARDHRWSAARGGPPQSELQHVLS